MVFHLFGPDLRSAVLAFGRAGIHPSGLAGADGRPALRAVGGEQGMFLPREGLSRHGRRGRRGDAGAKFAGQSTGDILHALVIQCAGDAGIKFRRTLVHLLFQKEVQGQARLEQGGRALLVVGKGKGGLGVQVCGARGMVGALHV